MDGARVEPALEIGQLAVMVDVMPDPVLVFDQTAHIVLANARMADATGYPAEELVGNAALMLVPEDLRGELVPRMAAYAASPVPRAFGEGLETRIARKDGSTFEAQMANTPIRTPDGLVVLSVLRDLIDLSLDEIRFRGLLESSPDATLIVSSQGRVVLSNGRALRLFGRERIHLFDQQLEPLFPDQDVGDLLESIRECQDAFLAGTFADERARTIELLARSAGGSNVPVEVSVGPMQTTQGLMARLVVRDISERLRLQREADQMKADFLATVSHELRTPLTSILGYGELLEDLAPPEVHPQAHAFVEIIGRNARRELRLVDDLLTTVQIGDGSFGVRPAHIDLQRVVHDAIEAAQPAAREAEVVLSVVTDDLAAPVFGDYDRLGQALDALLSNAIKFSPTGADVVVDLRTTDDLVTVVVSDAGPGIPTGDLGNVFERLYRGENAIVAHVPGAGLGLPIVRSIIEAHHGSVRAVAADVGARFEITLPRERRPRLPAARSSPED